MTLTLAWVRRTGRVGELVVASDSRLRPFAWDAAPKIVPLPRGDSVVAFSGDTFHAYPMMLQMVNTIASWDRAANRSQPLEEAKGHLLRVLNRMLDEWTDRPTHLAEDPAAFFLLAGFSWMQQRFRIWTLHYDAEIEGFTFRPASRWKGKGQDKTVAIVGDHLTEAKDRLVEILDDSGTLHSGSLDMEPIRVLTEFIDSPVYPTIGGHPQVVKVYPSLRAVPFVVLRHGVRSLLGRPLLDYEAPDRYPEITL